MQQQTLANTVTISGIGTHSAQPATITVRPANVSTGFVFVRSDIKTDNVIHASWRNVHSTLMSTQICNDSGISIATIEHLLAALWGMGITNAHIEINGPEIPIMDGSALPFVEKIKQVGIVKQRDKVSSIRILKPVEIRSDYGFARFDPANELSLSMDFSFGQRWPGHVYHMDFVLISDTFAKEIAPARTFGFYEDAEALLAKGLAKGSSLENVIVIKDGTVINEEGLRFEDEFIRHKILDAIGDLSLAGHYIFGKFTGSNSGHGMNSQLLHALFQDSTAYEIT